MALWLNTATASSAAHSSLPQSSVTGSEGNVSMQEEGFQARAAQAIQVAPLKERMVESLAELADLHDDVRSWSSSFCITREFAAPSSRE